MDVPAGGITVRGWLVRARQPTHRAVVLIHGISDNRVGMLPFLPILDPLDVNVALIDLRAHGETGGDALTYGVREREDVKAVVDGLIRQDLARPGTVGLIGWSLGGAIALQAAAIDGRVGAVVTDGAFARLRPLIAHRARQVFPPAVTVAPLGAWLAERRAGFAVAEASPAVAAERVRCPVLLIHGAADRVVPPSHATELAAAVGETAQVWMVPDVGHCEALDADETTYARRVRDFLQRHIAE
jgi:pimeloyl-ACP methyl ester carboxylesterase